MDAEADKNVNKGQKANRSGSPSRSPKRHGKGHEHHAVEREPCKRCIEHEKKRIDRLAKEALSGLSKNPSKQGLNFYEIEKELAERQADQSLHGQYTNSLEDPNLNFNKMHKNDKGYTDKRLNHLVNQYKTDKHDARDR